MRGGRKDLTDVNPERREGISEVEAFQGTKTPPFRNPRTMYPLISGVVPMKGRLCLGTLRDNWQHDRGWVWVLVVGREPWRRREDRLGQDDCSCYSKPRY